MDPEMIENWSLDTDELIREMQSQAESRSYWRWDRIHVDLSGKDSDLTDYGYRGIEILDADEDRVRVGLHGLWSFHDPDCTDPNCESELCEQTAVSFQEMTFPWVSDDTPPHSVRYAEMAAEILAYAEDHISQREAMLT